MVSDRGSRYAREGRRVSGRGKGMPGRAEGCQGEEEKDGRKGNGLPGKEEGCMNGLQESCSEMCLLNQVIMVKRTIPLK